MQKPKRRMADSMRKSLQAEEARVQARFQKADTFFGDTEATPAPKPEIEKVIRDTFSMPADDHALLDQLRTRALSMGQAVTKSEFVRAGLRVLAELADPELLQALSQVEKLKPGRPKY